MFSSTNRGRASVSQRSLIRRIAATDIP